MNTITPIILITIILIILVYAYKTFFIGLEQYQKIKVFFGFIFTLCLYSAIMTIIKQEPYFELNLLLEIIGLFLSATLFFTLKKK